MLSETADPQRAPELLVLRERIRSWRFYDYLRTDAQPLVTAFQASSARMLELVKEDGRTLLDGQGILDETAWHWPSR